MRAPLSLVLFAVAVGAGAGAAHALPVLKAPQYAYEYRLADAEPPAGSTVRAPFDVRIHDGAPLLDATSGDTSRDFYLFEPRPLVGPALGEAPVIVYLHGASMNPRPSWERQQIEHFVGAGYTVVYPVYCNRSIACFDFDKNEGYLHDALLLALARLERPGHARPLRRADGRVDLSFVGHSLGTILGTRLAATLAREHGPTPQTLVWHDPAGYSLDVIRQILPLDAASLGAIRADTLQVILAAQINGDDPSGGATIEPIQLYSGAGTKVALVVPHECARLVDGVVRYDCPSGLQRGGDVHTLVENIYVSAHGSPADESGHYTALSWNGWFTPTLACVGFGRTGQGRDACDGAAGRAMGGWYEGAQLLRAAAPKVDYPFPHQLPLPPDL